MIDMDSIKETLDIKVKKLLDNISTQISKDFDISVQKITESIEKVTGPLEDREQKCCKGIVTSTNKRCTVMLPFACKHDYCKRHMHYMNEKIDPPKELCTQICKNGNRCELYKQLNSKWCEKHTLLNNTPQSINKNANTNHNVRTCVYSEVDDKTDFKRCKTIVNDNYYTCIKHRTHEDFLKQSFELNIDANEFDKLIYSRHHVNERVKFNHIARYVFT